LICQPSGTDRSLPVRIGARLPPTALAMFITPESVPVWRPPTSIAAAQLTGMTKSLASFANDFVIPVSWAAAMDVGGRHTGTLSGVMNMASAVGGSLAPILTGYLLSTEGGWKLNFWISAGVYLLGLCCWLFLDPVTPLETSSEAKPEGEPA